MEEMSLNFYVYAYLRKDGTPYYIGKGKDNRAYSNTGRTIKTPSKDRIIFLLTNLTEDQAFANEIDYIKFYGRKDNNTGILRNLTDGGEGTSGYIYSEETRKKISEGHKGKIVSERTREKLRQYNLGHKHSEETKEKLREAMRNRPNPLDDPEIRKKLSESLRNSTKVKDYHNRIKGKPGKKLSEETKKKISIAKTNPSEETRKRLRESHLGYKQSEETKKKRAEAIRRFYENNEEARKKISETHKGKPKSEEHKNKLREAKKKCLEKFENSSGAT